MPPRSRAAKYAEDPMVTFRPDIVRAVLEDRDVKVTQLAAKMGELQQTMAALVKGDTPKKVRASRLRALAVALDVPEAMLQGKFTYVPTGGPHGFEFRYSARTLLAAERLFERSRRAFKRDIRAERKRGAFISRMREFILWSYLEDSLAELLKIGAWRELLIEWPPDRHPRQGYAEPGAERYDVIFTRPAKDPAHEAATLALVQAFGHVLEPWFGGKAALDYGRLSDLTAAPEGGLPPKRTNVQAIIPLWHPEGQPEQERDE